MLNLKIGGYYVIRYAYQSSNIPDKFCKIKSKTIHSRHIHSYFVSQPLKGSKVPSGTHIWDYGVANKNKTYFFHDCAISSCREMTQKEFLNFEKDLKLEERKGV